MTAHNQPAQLKSSINAFLDANGDDIVKQFEEANKLLFAWIRHLHSTQMTGTANYMLEGVGSLLRETVANMALGLGRSALFSMRGQLDLLFSWQYFKDHPVELKVVETTGEGFKLVSEILLFLEKTNKQFKTRMKILEQVRQRKIEAPYHLLSAHVHGQSSLVVPTVAGLKDVVVKRNFVDSVLSLQTDCSEYMSDVFMALHLEDWASIPAVVQGNLSARKLSENQRTALFAANSEK